MNRFMRINTLILLGSALCSMSAMAQTGTGASQPGGRPIDRSVPAIAGLRVGVTARFSASGTSSEGKVAKIRPDSIWVSSGGGLIALPLQSVDSAWTLERRTEKGAAIGAVAGAIGVGTLAAFYLNILCENSNGCGSDYPLAVIFGGLIGALPGTLVGAGVGSLVQRWQRRIPER